MKTSLKALTTISIVIMNLNLNAQRSHNGSQNQTQNHPQPAHNNNQHDKHHVWASNNHHGPNWGGNVSIHIGGYPSYNNYAYYNNNYFSIKKAARNSIRQSANTIGQALQFSEWNDTYSPWLAKAIRHQQYAKQLYFWGDYEGALNHSERAGFLAWNTLNYFNDSYSYNNSSYPDPYSDPDNPYYRQSNPNSPSQPNTNSDEDYGYRKGSTEKTTDESSSVKRETQTGNEQKKDKAELDKSLPVSKLNDKELLKMNAKDLDVE